MKAPLPPDEKERLAALHEYQILDTEPEEEYDDITLLAAQICQVPIALISLVDESRQWFKSKLGVRRCQTPRDVAFCAHAILQAEPLIIRDALKDFRFADNALVKRSPHIRFYAGFPLLNPQGHSLGTLCAIDRRPRQLSPSQDRAMRALSRVVISRMELRRISAHLACELEKVKTLHGLLPICSWCKRIRDDHGYWNQVETYISAHTEADFTHGICPECKDRLIAQTRPKESRYAPD